MLIRLSSDERISLQCQLFEQMRGLILDGTLKGGEKLPSSRALSETLSVSRNTVILAYARLADEGYIDMRGSVGTFVSSQIPDVSLCTNRNARSGVAKSVPTPTPSPHHNPRAQTLVNPHQRRLTADFWVGRPDARSFPIKIWTKLIHSRLMTAGGALTEYKDPSGLRELRQAIVDHLRPARGIRASAEQVIIVGGCQDGLNLISRMLVSPATTAVLEDPCYQGAAYLFESVGARIHPIAVDAKGMLTERLPDKQRCVAYVTPSHQYPLGVTLSLDRRLDLVRWAAATDSYILEDDYDSDFRFNGAPIAALKGLDGPERVIYLGTFSKCLGAGLRIGYVLVPPTLAQLAQTTKTLWTAVARASCARRFHAIWCLPTASAQNPPIVSGPAQRTLGFPIKALRRERNPRLRSWHALGVATARATAKGKHGAKTCPGCRGRSLRCGIGRCSRVWDGRP